MSNTPPEILKAVVRLINDWFEDATDELATWIIEGLEEECFLELEDDE